MPSLTPLTLVLAAASLAYAQIPATIPAGALALADGQYLNSGFAAQSLTGFGTPLKSQAILTVQYGFGPVVNGAAYTTAQVASAPTIFVTPPGASSNLALYTLILADAASLGDPDVQGNYRHFLANSLVGAAGSSASNLTFTPSGGRVITSYASPGPIAGTGPHRYCWLLLTQPTGGLVAPANLSSTTAAGHWNVSSYVQSTGLTLIAASFFTVQNGAPTGSVVATSAFSTRATAASASSTGLATSRAVTSGSASSAASSASTPASTPKPAGASSIFVSSGLLLVAGCGALFF